MAHFLEKETGAGSATANAYENTANAEEYLEKTNRKKHGVWPTLATHAKEAALFLATQYMDDTYGHRYLGVISEATQDVQGLLWPRDGLTLPSGAPIASAEIPEEIREACVEFALISAEGNLDPNPTYDATGRSIKEQAVRVEGAVSKKTVYDGGTRPTTKRRHPEAERILRKWLTPVSRTLLRA